RGVAHRRPRARGDGPPPPRGARDARLLGTLGARRRPRARDPAQDGVLAPAHGPRPLRADGPSGPAQGRPLVSAPEPPPMSPALRALVDADSQRPGPPDGV